MFPNFPESTKPKILIGLMSGTSVDGIDACCVKFWVDAGRLHFEVLGTHTHDFPLELTRRLLTAMTGKSVRLAELCELNFLVGEHFAQATLELMETHSLRPEAIDAIGSHGQTMYHSPPAEGKAGSTLQIGEPSIIAERTGITTIADFRPRDMAAGGHGAPLVPFADVLLLQDVTIGRAVQNIGGIANVTVLPAAGQGELFAFDTGPGNMLMDELMWQRFEQSYDAGGAKAAEGTVNFDLLERWLDHYYFAQEPPKTTGREMFGFDYLIHYIIPTSKYPKVKTRDLMATLNFYTAKTIVDAYERFVFPKVDISEVIIGGGGLYNKTLMKNLETLFQETGKTVTLQGHEAYGIPSKFKEALAFALLAWANLEGIPNNVPSCTGAKHPVVMGKLIPS